MTRRNVKLFKERGAAQNVLSIPVSNTRGKEKSEKSRTSGWDRWRREGFQTVEKRPQKDNAVKECKFRLVLFLNCLDVSQIHVLMTPR